MTAPLNYSRRGDRAGMPLVLLHSVGLDLTFWDPVIERLGPRETIAVDLRGHGRSPSPPGPWRLEDLADDVAAVMEYAGITRAHVVGQSFGGLVAQHLVIRRPDLVASVVLSGTSCTTSASEYEMFLDRAERAEAGGMEPVAAAAVARWFTDEGLKAPVVAEVRQRLLADDPAAWAKTFRAIAQHNVLDRLRDVRTRALVVTGNADVATPPRFAYEMAEALPNSELVIPDGVPHMGYLECPDLISRTIASFVDRPHEGIP
jgi:3-oxoadipate enol-lactonase